MLMLFLCSVKPGSINGSILVPVLAFNFLSNTKNISIRHNVEINYACHVTIILTIIMAYCVLTRANIKNIREITIPQRNIVCDNTTSKFQY